MGLAQNNPGAVIGAVSQPDKLCGYHLHVDKADGFDAWRELLIRLGIKAAKLKPPTATGISSRSKPFCAQ